MYDVRNRGDAIRELNAYLLDVAYVDPRIPRVSLEPFFSGRTTEALLAFQQTEGLSPTGVADFETWQLLWERARRIRLDRARERDPDIPQGLPLSVGAVGHPVLVLQSTIAELAEYYDELPRLATTGSYRSGTAYAVSLLQKKYGLAETGITDAETWERILGDHATRDRLSVELNR
jgi:peptidoglycan hydrolase-like protein with peptidoglycan-binding domain